MDAKSQSMWSPCAVTDTEQELDKCLMNKCTCGLRSHNRTLRRKHSLDSWNTQQGTEDHGAPPDTPLQHPLEKQEKLVKVTEMEQSRKTRKCFLGLRVWRDLVASSNATEITWWSQAGFCGADTGHRVYWY